MRATMSRLWSISIGAQVYDLRLRATVELDVDDERDGIEASREYHEAH